MDTAEFDTKIAEHEKTIAIHRAEAETHVAAFCAEVATAFKAWGPRALKTFASAEARHAKTQKLGTEKIADLKAEIQVFFDGAEDVVGRRIGKAPLWPHREDYQPSPYFNQYPDQEDRGHVWSTRLESAINGPLELSEALDGLVANTIGKAVRAAGYDFDPPPVAGRAPKFSPSFPLPETAMPALRKYVVSNKAVHAEIKALKKVQEAKGRAVAADLWERS